MERGTTLGALRTTLLALVLFGSVGTGAELLLLDHDENAFQLIPLGLIALVFVVLAWHAIRPRAASIRALQATMVCCIVSGVVGIVLHYHGNMEFQLEVNPSLHGMPLFWKIMQAKAPPALAPAVMSELGIMGLAYAYRHPALSDSTRTTANNRGA